MGPFERIPVAPVLRRDDTRPATRTRRTSSSTRPHTATSTTSAADGDPEPRAVPHTQSVLKVLYLAVRNPGHRRLAAPRRLRPAVAHHRLPVALGGGLLLLGGRIADLLPRRRVSLTDMTIFTAMQGIGRP